MLIECVSEANQALYTDIPAQQAMDHRTSWMHGRGMYGPDTSSVAQTPTPNYNYQHHGGVGAYPNPGIRNRYIKQWLQTLRPGMQGTPHSKWSPSQHYAWQQFMTFQAVARHDANHQCTLSIMTLLISECKCFLK